MKKLYSFLTLLLCLVVATPSVAETASTSLADGYYYIYNVNSGLRLTEGSSNALSCETVTSTDTKDYTAVWKLVKNESTSTYTLQNLSTGNYIQVQTTKNSKYTTGTSSYGFSLVESSQSNGVQYYFIRNSAGTSEVQNGLHSNNGGTATTATVVAFTGTGDRNEWKFESLTITDDDIKALHGITSGKGGIYTIASPNRGGVLKEDASTGKLVWGTASTSTDPEYLALWRLTETSESGVYTLQNVGTTNYVQVQNTNDAQYTTAATPANFYLRLNYTGTDGTEYWNFGNDLYMSESFNAQPNTYKVVAWNTVGGGSGTSNAEWTLTAVTLTDEQISEAETTYSGNARFDGWYTVHHRYSGLNLYDNPTSSDGKTLRIHTPNDTDYTEYWRISGTLSGGVTMQNAKTMRYVVGYNTTGTTATTVYPSKYTVDGVDYYAFNLSSDESTPAYMYRGVNGETDYNLVKGTTGSNIGAHFLLTKQSLADDQIVEARADYLGYSTPKAGKYYQIFNPHDTTYLSVTGLSGELQHVAQKSGNYQPYSQYWQLIAAGSGYRLKNVYTNVYVDNTLSGKRYTTSSDGDAFYITRNTSFDLLPYYNIKVSASNANSLHGQTAGGTVVSWACSTSGSISASEWIFKEVTLTDEQIAAAQADYTTNVKLNSGTYNAALLTFFTDYTCSELKTDYQSMTDDELTTAMTDAGLPELFQTMAVKIKNNAWANKYDKLFRVATYEPYSNPDTWASNIGCNTFTYYEQPTGIYVNRGDQLYVYVEQNAKTNSSLQLRVLPMDASSGSTAVGLHAGVNVVLVDETGNAFISYHGATADGGTMLSAYPDIKIHIEGGTLNGYFDARNASTSDPRRGMTDADWKQMWSDGLFSCDVLNMRSEKFMFSMTSDFVKKANATTMRSNLAVWDSIGTWEDDLLGANDKYWTNFSKYCNNIYGAHTMTKSYMNATTYGTNYNRKYSEMASVLQLDPVYTSPWGPAHENGHCRQKHINLIGDTEVSNNLFSNMCLWKRGYYVSRGNPITEALTAFNTGNKFYFYYGDVRIRMYWQLYLYYEVAGHCPGFYQKLFKALRADPLVRKNGETNTNYGKDGYLKFALKCCEVSGDDLTEFFQAWGFFVPVEERKKVDDYAVYYILNTKDEIAAAKAEMAKYNKGAENLIFIEDRIERSAAEYPGASATATRADLNSQAAVGKCGDVGSFLDYKTTANVKASNYLYTISGSTVTINSASDGAVGYKVYDASGNLVALYNKNTFTLPSTLADGYKIVAAQADGTDVEVPNSASTYYPLTAYYGTSDAVTVNVTSDIPTASEANALYVVKSSANAPTTITEATNVLVQSDESTDETTYTAANVVLTDKSDFYSPADFTATTVSYTRSNTAGYNSVCLPFATAASDYGTGSIIYSMGNLADNSYIYITSQDAADAGQPVLVYCPDDVTEWTISKADASVVATPVENASSAATLYGSFVNKSIGANHYKLTAAGTAFGITTDAGKLVAFRTYMDLNGGASTSRLGVRIADEATGINAVNANAIDADAWYDLQGRRVATPTKGIYLHGGRKVIVR